MSGLSVSEIDALLDAVGYRCHHTGPVDPTVSTGCRDCQTVVTIDIEPVVEQIVAARVTAALDDLATRMRRAEDELTAMANTAASMSASAEAARLRAKREGVGLARDYLRAAIPTDPASRADRSIDPP